MKVIILRILIVTFTLIMKKCELKLFYIGRYILLSTLTIIMLFQVQFIIFIT